MCTFATRSNAPNCIKINVIRNWAALPLHTIIMCWISILAEVNILLVYECSRSKSTIATLLQLYIVRRVQFCSVKCKATCWRCYFAAFDVVGEQVNCALKIYASLLYSADRKKNLFQGEIFWFEMFLDLTIFLASPFDENRLKLDLSARTKAVKILTEIPQVEECGKYFIQIENNV